MEEQPALPELLPSLLEAVTTVAKLDVPDASDIYYYRNIPEYKDLSSACSTQMEQLLRTARLNLIRPSSTAAAAVLAADDDDLEESMYVDVVSILDDTFERLDTALDASKQQTEQYKLGGWATSVGGRQAFRAMAKGLDPIGATAGHSRSRIQRHVAHLPRPQDSFPDPVDNSHTPWTPSRFQHLAAKLKAAAAAAMQPAVDKLQAHAAQLAAAGRVIGDDSCSSNVTVLHPYADELSSLSYQPWQLEAPAESAAADLDATPFTLVESPNQLWAMVDALKGHKQIALDLEHHSYRSFQGFSCLLQLSTSSHDYVVDCLSLRSQLGPALAQVLADAGVEKVLHGADSDVMWLQRDFGLYIVNLFDTGQAARVLNYPSAGLAYLLERHAGFKADKRYQLADWRVRPLPDDMLHYARCDTHFLLPVSDQLKRELLAAGERVPQGWSVVVPRCAGTGQSALGIVFERSRQLCCATYQKPLFMEHSYIEQAARWQLNLPPKNMAVFAALYAWRDRTARVLDESVSYIMPKAALIELSRVAPQTAADLRKLLSAAPGLSGGSGLLLTRAEEVVQVILNGQQQAAVPAPAPAAGGSNPPLPPAAAAAAVVVQVKPRELPALKSRVVAGLTAKRSAGLRGIMMRAGGKQGAAGTLTAPAAVATTAVPAAGNALQSITVQKRQQDGVSQHAAAADEAGGQQQEQQEKAPQRPVVEPRPAVPAEDGQQQKQQQQQQQQQDLGPVPDDSVAPAPPLKSANAVMSRKRGGSSLAGLLASKPKLQHSCQQQQPAAAKAASIKTENFKLPFMVASTTGRTVFAGDDKQTVQPVGSLPLLSEQQQQEEEKAEELAPPVTGAEIRMAVDQLMAEGDHDAQQQQEQSGDDDQGEDAAVSTGDGSSALADLEYVPLSAQIQRKKYRQRGDKQQQQQQQPAVEDGPVAKKRKVANTTQPAAAAVAIPVCAQHKKGGIFADASISDSDASSSSDDDGSDDGLLPSYDPTAARKTAAAALGDWQQQQQQHVHPSATVPDRGGEPGSGSRGSRGSRGGRGRGRGDRGSGGRYKRGGFMAAATASLAAVRAKQGGGGVGANPFAIPDSHMMKAGKRSAVAPRGGNRSASFK